MITDTSIETLHEIPVNAQEIIDEYNSSEELSLENNVFPEEPDTEEILDETTSKVLQEIPVNSPTLLVDNFTSRFKSSIWYNKIQEQSITLAGLGGIGSWTALLLSRVKPKEMCFYDDDRVEESNISGQLYSKEHLGRLKVNTIANIISKYSNYYMVYGNDVKFDENSPANRIMICGFDNMKSRKIFFDSWLKLVNNNPYQERDKFLFIDGRLAAEEFQIFCIKGDDTYNIEEYTTKYLFSDKEADETICSYKQTSFCACLIASYIVNLFVNFCANQTNPLVDRDLPFLTTYNAETMYFKTKS